MDFLIHGQWSMFIRMACQKTEAISGSLIFFFPQPFCRTQRVLPPLMAFLTAARVYDFICTATGNASGSHGEREKRDGKGFGEGFCSVLAKFRFKKVLTRLLELLSRRHNYFITAAIRGLRFIHTCMSQSNEQISFLFRPVLSDKFK
jgi:hypothetical protein